MSVLDIFYFIFYICHLVYPVSIRFPASICFCIFYLSFFQFFCSQTVFSYFIPPTLLAFWNTCHFSWEMCWERKMDVWIFLTIFVLKPSLTSHFLFKLICSLFHQHFLSIFLPIFFCQKKILAQIESTEKLCITQTKEHLVKYWWIWQFDTLLFK